MNVQRSSGDGKPEQEATWTVFCARVIFDKLGSRHCFSKLAYINSTPDALVQCVLRVLELPAFHLGPDLFNKTPSLRAHFRGLTSSARCRGRLAELEWRFNNRKNPHIFLDTLRRIMRTPHMTYRELIDKAA